jgi:hypothetical protein
MELEDMLTVAVAFIMKTYLCHGLQILYSVCLNCCEPVFIHKLGAENCWLDGDKTVVVIIQRLSLLSVTWRWRVYACLLSSECVASRRTCNDMCVPQNQ